MKFKLVHPQDLLSRLFILDYMREIGATNLYEKANETQRKNFFYKFINEGNNQEEIDLNWEFCLFESTLQQLEFFMRPFMEEIEKIDVQFTEENKKRSEQVIKEQISEPSSISLYDIAKAEMNKNKEDSSKSLIGIK